jgi:hypothetical protein
VPLCVLEAELDVVPAVASALEFESFHHYTEMRGGEMRLSSEDEIE